MVRPIKMTQVIHNNAGAAWSHVSADTVVELIDNACRRNPTKPAMIFEDGVVVTREEFRDQTERFAYRLAGKITAGDRVAVMLENRAEFMFAFAAVVAVRGVFVPVAPSAKMQDAGYQLRESDCTVAIISETNQELLQDLRSNCPFLREVIILSGEEPDGLLPTNSKKRLRLRDCSTDRNDVTAIYYTSGTSAMPKGCMLDHSWWLRACDIHLRLTKPRPGTRQLCCLPFYHVDPVAQLLSALHCNGTLVIMRRFSVSRFWTVVRQLQVSEIYIVASMPALLLKGEPTPQDRCHTVERAICAAVPSSLHREFADRFGIVLVDTYGSTEVCWVTRTPLHVAETKIGSGSMGVAVPGVHLKVVDEFGADVPTNCMGELLIRGPGMFTGYNKQPQATATACLNGWYHSGDTVRVDEQGFYYFLGRKKDFIRRSGENIACVEVEEVLRGHPCIVDAALIAVPDDIHGEEARACVLLKGDASVATVPPDQIVAYCHERLATFKVPRYIEYWTTDFPRTPTMRVKKEQMKHSVAMATWDRVSGGWVP
jgi:carnitine-CoA ligase